MPTPPSRSPGSPAPRRHEGKAGGLRLLLRQAGRRTEPRARPGDPRRAAQDIRERSALVVFTCCGSLLGGGEAPALSGRGRRAVRGPPSRTRFSTISAIASPGPVGPRSPPRRAGSWASTSPTCVSSARTGPRRYDWRAYRVTAERLLQPSLERPPLDLGAKPGEDGLPVILIHGWPGGRSSSWM